MKKILSLVLAASMVLGSASIAMAAPADVEGTKYEDAVERLQALEIINGYEDGTYKPENTITRAEFAKIMVTTLGVGEAAKYASGETKFNDVAADHWAAGYVNVASDMGIINGYGDGNFGPSDQVTYAQAITMIVRGLGYEPKASSLGGYPGGYIAVAAEKDITDDVNVVNSLAANRGDVATMVDNALDVPMMVQTSFGNNPEWAEDPDKTILTSKHDIEEIKGYVTETPRTDDTLKKDEVKVGSKKFKLLVDTNLDNLLGVKVNLWSNDDNEVFFVEQVTAKEDIKFDTIKEVNGDVIKLEEANKEYTLADDAKVTVNFKDGTMAEGLYGYVVLNEEDKVASFVGINAADSGAVYSVKDDEVKFVDATASKDDVDFSDYDDGVVVFDANFNVIDKDAIKEGTTIFTFEDDEMLYVVAANKTVEGELTKVKETELTIGGKKYSIVKEGSDFNLAYSTNELSSFARYAGMESLKDLTGENVKASLDLNGDLVLVYGDVEATSSDMFGIVTYANTTNKSVATVFDKDGNEKDYTFKNRSDGNALTGLKYFEDGTDLTFAIMKFSLNSDGEISERTITNVDMSTSFNTLTKSADRDYVTFNGARYYISKDTIFMTAVNSSDELAPSALSYDDIYASAIDSNNQAIVIGEAGKDADMIVFMNKAFEGTNDELFYGIVTDSAAKTSDGYVLTVHIVGEGEKEIKIDEADKGIAVGTALEFKYDSKGELTKTTKNPADIDVSAADDKVVYSGGFLEQTISGTTTYIKVADDVIVYELDGSDVTKTKLSKVKNYANIEVLKDGDDLVKVIIVENEK